ncbi:MAG: Uma2 family endonuclease [Dehalococcoidia bacterium]|nr:Uma2 family endonuclease [Dehalococcoidia bacterium]MDW8120227.1 Uma2 family endonuclease [Chloroflexota bacterium]
MAQPSPRLKFTYHDYRTTPPGKRYELREGDLVMVPAPSDFHQAISMNLSLALGAYIRQRRLGHLRAAPYDVVLSPTDVVQPDLVFISPQRAPFIRPEGCFGPPDLVVEILSPSSAEVDRGYKRSLYARHGVREYWLVDPDTRTVEVLTLGEEGFRLVGLFRQGERLVSPLFPDLTLTVSDVFAEGG